MKATNKLKVDDVQFNLDEVAAKFDTFSKFKDAHSIDGYAEVSYKAVWDAAQKAKAKQPEHVPVIEKKKKDE